MTQRIAILPFLDILGSFAEFTETAEVMSCCLLSPAKSAHCQAAVGEAAPGMNCPLLDAANTR